MASKAECDRYAAELSQRFEDLTKWAVANWPNKEFPLLLSDFSESRREIGQVLGPKLGDGEGTHLVPAGGVDTQYRGVNPMPWP